MSGSVQLKCCARAVLSRGPWRKLGLTLAPMLLWAGSAAITCAQQPQNTVGNITGNDVSVATGASSGDATPASGASTVVTNGGIVSVHSGQARLMLLSGGEIDLCGPAKFTVLQSGDAITVALDFGSVRVQLPASTNLRIFTPTIIATPLDINGAPRDVTLGLQLDDSLCVKAESGALLLENQFSSEKLVVPQSGEFFLGQGKLVPVASADPKCACVMSDARLIPSSAPLPILGLTAPAHNVPSSQAPPAAEFEDEATKPNIEFSTLGHANEAHPVNPRQQADAPVPPPDSMPTYKIVMPPLTFSASMPAPPPEPTADMVLLIRTVEVEPEWEFKGHVDAPSMDEPTKAQKAKTPSHGRQPKPAGEKSGFWAKVRRFFGGSNT